MFTRSGSTWTQQGEKLQGPSGEIEGRRIRRQRGALLRRQHRADRRPDDNKGVGAAWAFTRSGSTWTQQGEKLIAKAGEEIGAGEFGASVALSSDHRQHCVDRRRRRQRRGRRGVGVHPLGLDLDPAGRKSSPRSGEIGAGEFGQSVALSSEGNTALIGGPGDNEHVGAAWVLTRSGTTWTQQEKLTGSGGSGAGNFGFSVALSSEGNTALMGGPTDNRDVGAAWVFANNAPTVVTKAASPVTQTTATLNATVNPNGGEVSECKFEYGDHDRLRNTPSCASLPGSGTSPVAVSAAVTALTANTTYHFRISATNPGGTSKGHDETLKTLPNAPTVVTAAASSVTQTTATLNATVNPNGGEVSECKFEYGTTTPTDPPRSCASLPGSGTSPVAVSACGHGPHREHHLPLQDLRDQRGRHEQRLGPDAQNAAERPDGRETKAASSVTQTTATLNATVNPNGGEVSECKFEYGTTDAYGSTALVRLAAGVGDQPGRGVRVRSRASRRTPPTTSGSPRPTRAARAKAQT